MTTIAWDGTTLAADRQLNIGDLKFSCCKVFRLDDGGLLGGAGNYEDVLAIRDWMDGGERPNDIDNVECIHVDVNRRASRIETRLLHMPISETCHAVGSGAPYALAAMACGKTSPDAVRIAMRFDPGTGVGVDAIRLARVRRS